jgi:lipid II:glycine glycyltransferase (peptidoglycan interpeptide bridge formation enzyme)
MQNNFFEILYNLEDERIVPFLLKNENASVYHHPAWLKAIAKSFKHKSFYLIKTDGHGEITGLIPFVYISSKFTGKRIISLPFSTYCDPLLSSEDIKPAITFLRSYFNPEIKIDIRTLFDLKTELTEFLCDSGFTTHVLYMDDSLEATFNSFHGRSVRASIRRAEKNDLGFEVLNNIKGLRIFYKLETELRKRLLLPPLPYIFFKNVFDELSKYNMISIPIVTMNNIPIAAGFILEFKDTTYLEYAATDKNYLGLYTNQKLFWEIIKSAHIKGIRKIDFGRTSVHHQSLKIFKEKWNAKASYILNYSYPVAGVINANRGKLNKIMKNINKYLPTIILKAEGKLLYHHLD